MKTCRDCQQEKSEDEFYFADRARGYRKSYCIECDKVRQATYRAAHPEAMRSAWSKASRKKSRKKYRYKSRYGVTEQDVEEMRAEQQGLCAICKRSEELMVDHCHDSLEVRGLLCRSCNLALGYLRDDVEILQSAIEYLSRRGRAVGSSLAS